MENLKGLGYAAVALLPSELQKIGSTTLHQALRFLKDVEVHVDQVRVVDLLYKTICQLGTPSEGMRQWKGVIIGVGENNITSSFPRLIHWKHLILIVQICCFCLQ